MKIAIAAGGTAGHVFPALALYQRLKSDGANVQLLTDERGQKFAADFDSADVVILPSGGVVTGSIVKRVKNVSKLAAGYQRARRLIKQSQPDAVVGMGGYAAVGPLLAAQHLGIRSVLHEQNSVMGLANKVSARRASVVALSFDPTEGAKGNTVVTGNPCRPEIVAIGAEPFRVPTETDELGVLVMGGSQGARSISDHVPAALGALPVSILSRLRVVHQARPEDHERVKAAYGAARINADIRSFVDVPAALAQSHLVITRSGASTVCDVAVARRPAIYLPLLTHSDLQQVKNAQAVVGAGGAVIHREDQVDVSALAGIAGELLESPYRLATMADAAYAWSRPDAADAILKLIVTD